MEAFIPVVQLYEEGKHYEKILYVFIFVFVLSSLMAWNGLSLSSYIHPGEKLVIYQ